MILCAEFRSAPKFNDSILEKNKFELYFCRIPIIFSCQGCEKAFYRQTESERRLVFERKTKKEKDETIMAAGSLRVFNRIFLRGSGYLFSLWGMGWRWGNWLDIYGEWRGKTG